MNAPDLEKIFEEGISDGKREVKIRSLEGRRHHVGVGLLLLLHQLLASDLERDSEADLGRLLLEKSQHRGMVKLDEKLENRS